MTIDHRAHAARLRGDLNAYRTPTEQVHVDPAGTTARAALATAHEMAALVDLTTEIRDLIRALAGPAVDQAADAAELDQPEPLTVVAPVLHLPFRDDHRDHHPAPQES